MNEKVWEGTGGDMEMLARGVSVGVAGLVTSGEAVGMLASCRCEKAGWCGDTSVVQ